MPPLPKLEDAAAQIALTLKPKIDRAIARFGGKKPTPALARRMELVLRNLKRTDPAFRIIQDFEPVVTFDNASGRPFVNFFRRPPVVNDQAASR